MSDLRSSSDASALRQRLYASLDQKGRNLKRWFIGVAVVLIAGGWAFNTLRGTTAATSVDVSALPRAGTSSPTTASAGGSAAGSDSGEPTATTMAAKDRVIVQVIGAVITPGVYELPNSARVNDAIAKAGGMREGADGTRVNLAAKLVDGQQIVVPLPGEVAVGAGAAPPSSSGDATPVGPVNLNSATEAQLDALPGVGPATAKAIVAYRDKHGAFTSVDGLKEVKGIGDAKFADLKDLVAV